MDIYRVGANDMYVQFSKKKKSDEETLIECDTETWLILESGKPKG